MKHNKIDYEIVGEWRKGFAIGKYKICISDDDNIRYDLIDSNYCAKKIRIRWGGEYPCIHRSLDGRYFVTVMVHSDAIQYPGKDSDTIDRLRPEIVYVYDENGNMIEEYGCNNRIYKYLKLCPIEYALEIGEGIVLRADATFDIQKKALSSFNPIDYIQKINKVKSPRNEYDCHSRYDYNYLCYSKTQNSRITECGEILCGNTLYDNENRQVITQLPKYIEPIGKFENGICKVGIVSDYRNFIVIVFKKIIQYVFEEGQFLLIAKILGIDIDKIKSLGSDIVIEPTNVPTDIDKIKIIIPSVDIEIQNYSLTMTPPYNLHYMGVSSVHDERFGIQRHKGVPCTCHYYINGEWIKIVDIDAQKVSDKIFEQECNRPNFIRDIERIASDVPIDGKKYSIFRFQCRPYGYITKDGKFDYDFDVEHIKW